jgi:protein TonB
LPAAAHAAADIVVISTRDDFLLELGAILGAKAATQQVESLSLALDQVSASRRAYIFVFDTRGMADLRNCVGRAYARTPESAIVLFVDAADEASMRRMFKGSKVFAVLPIPMDLARTALTFADALTDASARNGPAPMHIEAAPARPASTPVRTEAAPARPASTPVRTEAAPAHPASAPVRTARPASAPVNIEAAPSVPTTSLTPRSDGWGLGAGAALVVLACAWFVAADKHLILPSAAPATPSTPAKQASVNASADAKLAGAAKTAPELPAPASASRVQASQVASSPPSAADHSSVLQAHLNLIRYVVPEYPAAERARHVGGSVIVAYTVDTHGATRHVRVISAEPHGIFDRYAVNAVKLWRYAPVMVDNAAVAVPTHSTIRFTPP